MLAVTDGKAVTAQTTADAAKSTAQTALSKATANETNLIQYLKCRRMTVRYMVSVMVHG